MQVIHQFDLKIVDEQEIEMPCSSEVLTVGFAGSTPVLWVRMDPASVTIKRTIFLVGTGQQVPMGVTYINSLLMPSRKFWLHWWRSSH